MEFYSETGVWNKILRYQSINKNKKMFQFWSATEHNTLLPSIEKIIVCLKCKFIYIRITDTVVYVTNLFQNIPSILNTL
jgi:hypothetical protein